MTQELLSHYDYIYLTCVSSTRTGTIKQHMEFLNHYAYLNKSQKSVLFVISLRGGNSKDKELILEALGQNENPDRLHTILLEHKNWGMLVGALWDVWKEVEKRKITSDFVIAVEDDWLFNHWPEREKQLKENDFIYLGMFSYIVPSQSRYQQFLKQGYKNDIADQRYQKITGVGGERRWTDGGLYFLKYSSLKEIENKIGPFSLAPAKFNKYEHGITFGEVGFPSRLHHAGFKFNVYSGGFYIKDERWGDFSGWMIRGTPPSYFLEDWTPQQIVEKYGF